MDRLNFISEYLANTTFFRKVADCTLVAALLLVWGFASGKIHLPKTQPHTVKASFNTSRSIQKVLDIEQNKHALNFAGHFNFHNGTQGLSGFNFMKFSLTEYSSSLGIMVDAEALQNIPIVSSMKLVGALVDNQCYSSVLDPHDRRYMAFAQMNVRSYTACPVVSHNGALVAFVIFATNNPVPPNQADVMEAVKQVRLYHVK